MPFWCIDPVAGSDITGSVQASQAIAETTPYQSHAAVITAVPASGDSVLFKGGNLESGTQTMSVAGLVYGSYGTGKGGSDADGVRSALVIATATADNLTIDDLEFKGGKNDGANAITVIVSGDKVTDKAIALSNFYVHDAEPSEADGDGHGFDITAAGVSLTDGLIENFSDDGVYNEGDDNEFSYLTIRHVDQSVTSKSGDCLKFSSGGNCSNSNAHHCILDHTNTGRKQALLIAGAGPGQKASHNLCQGGEYTVNVTGDGVEISGLLVNPVEPGHSGNGTVVVTVTKSINIEGSNNRFTSCIVDTSELGTPNYGIQNVSGNSNTYQGCVLYGPLLSTQGNNAHLRFNAGTGHVIRNNIMGRGDGSANIYHITCGTSAAFAYCDYNIYLEDSAFRYTDGVGGTTYYANFAAWQAGNPGGFDANSQIISADTLFKDAANGDFRLNVGQEVLGVQLNYRDFLGNQNLPTIIGAYNQPLTDTAGSVTNAAGTVGTAAGTVLASSGILLNKKYPNWGIRA